MADVTKEVLRDRVLYHLGVIAPGQASAEADRENVDAEIDAAHARLHVFGCTPFDVSAIPDWAQRQLRDIVAFASAPVYGVSEDRLSSFRQRAIDAEADLFLQRDARAGGA